MNRWRGRGSSLWPRCTCWASLSQCFVAVSCFCALRAQLLFCKTVALPRRHLCGKYRHLCKPGRSSFDGQPPRHVFRGQALGKVPPSMFPRRAPKPFLLVANACLSVQFAFGRTAFMPKLGVAGVVMFFCCAHCVCACADGSVSGSVRLRELACWVAAGGSSTLLFHVRAENLSLC